MDADDERAATVDAVDDVRLPERPLAIERRGGEVADQVRQRRLIVRRRQRDVMQLLFDRKIRDVLPARGRDRQPTFDHALAKAPEPRQACRKHRDTFAKSSGSRVRRCR